MQTISLGLSFDDVYLIPSYSDIKSRKLIDLQANFSRQIKLHIPIVSANMDTVTESKMAIAMARHGGIGIIHRFMNLENQVTEVRKVKRAENFIIEEPITIAKSATLKTLLELMKSNNINGILVIGPEQTLEGIVTRRDVRFQKDLTVKVADIMTPKTKLITANPAIAREEAIKILNQHKIEKLPLVDENGKLKGLITSSDLIKMGPNSRAAKDKQGRLIVGAAIGVQDGLKRADKLISVGVDALVIDIAHGHHSTAIDLIKELKEKYTQHVDIVAGNIATAQATKDLILAGADAVKVGIGPGAACSTRIVAGAGVPQLTAIMESSKIAREHGVPIIADGGIKNSGDAAKAIGAGASSIMCGNFFAGTDESPGEYFIENGAAFKIYRGLASRDASEASDVPGRAEREPEGVSAKIMYKGSLKKTLNSLIDGLQSGMSYSGAKNISEFWEKAQFIRTTEAGVREGKPRI